MIHPSLPLYEYISLHNITIMTTPCETHDIYRVLIASKRYLGVASFTQTYSTLPTAPFGRSTGKLHMRELKPLADFPPGNLVGRRLLHRHRKAPPVMRC